MSPSRSTASVLARVFTLGISDTRWGRLQLRRTLSLGIRAILRIRSRPLKPEALGSALVVAPHPDDEAFGCGGTLALLARAGRPVWLAFVTDGSGSHPNHPSAKPADIARLRSAEARAAADVLGLDWNRARFLGAPDGALARLDAAGESALDEAVADAVGCARPSVVLTPCRRDGSSEHDAAFIRTSRAVGQANAGIRLLEFPVWSWWNPKLVFGAATRCPRIWRSDIRPVRDLKRRAMECYVSQTLPLPPQDDAALPPGFASLFLSPSEYFFEW